MTRDEIVECMNLFKTIWSSAFKEPTVERRKMYTEMWDKHLGSYSKEVVTDALYHLQANLDSRYEPNMKQILDAVRLVSKRTNVFQGERRIITPEEVRSNLFIEMVQAARQISDPNERTELMNRARPLKKDYLLFHEEGWQERYKQYFNTDLSREEYEKL